MSRMKTLATELGIDYSVVEPLEHTNRIRDDVRVNRIRYPRPNRLGLAPRV